MPISVLKPFITLTLLLALPTIAATPAVHLVQANPASFTLHGRIFPAPAGWGAASDEIASPGPTLTVAPGESVTMTLFSADGFPHNWGVDYNFNQASTPGEPTSTTFSSPTVPATFTFTATTTPGTYKYWCYIHLGPMVGDFVVTGPARDVAVTAMKVSRNFAYNGVPSSPIQVNVTAANPGTQTETFTVTARAGTNMIGSQQVALAPSATTVVTFSWDPTTLARGTYSLTAQASPVVGEFNPSNNNVGGGTFTVKFKGDVNGDCIVNIVDLSTVGANFGKISTNPTFVAAADLNNDLIINIVDLVLVAGTFGQTCA